MPFDLDQITPSNGWKYLKNSRNERSEIAHAIPDAAEKYDGDADRCEILQFTTETQRSQRESPCPLRLCG